MNDLRVFMQGGLGNQLFILNAGMIWADRTNKNLLLDTRTLKGHSIDRIYALDQVDFGISFELVHSRKATLFPYAKRLFDLLIKSEQNLRSFFRKYFGYYSESDLLKYRPDLSQRKIKYISGYFQSPTYFERVQIPRPILQNTSDWFRDLSREILEIKPIVLHFRAGDYFKHKDTFGVLGLQYYKDAITSLGQEFDSSEIWIFSDDLTSAKSVFCGFETERIKWIDPPSESRDIESLLLMSLAKTLIISNSTFSWWAGYWASDDSKVICPNKWTLNLKPQPELAMSSWTKIKSHWL